MPDPPPTSLLSSSTWKALHRLDPEADEEAVTLAACLALAEQRFQQLFGQVLRRFEEMDTQDLNAEADALGDAHHALMLLQDSLQASSRRLLDVLDRVSRELGE